MEASAPLVKWGKITRRADRVLIIASGPTFRSVDMAQIQRAADLGVHILAVNLAIEWLPVAHSWFSLDPDPKIRHQMREHDPAGGVTAYVAVPEDYGTEGARVGWHRLPPETGITYLHRLTGPGPAHSRWGLSNDPRKINTGNSAYGALGAAWLMGAQLIGILGLDGTQDGYAYGTGRPRGTFDHLPDLFASALPQLFKRDVTVLNGSPQSKITAFPRMHPTKLLTEFGLNF